MINFDSLEEVSDEDLINHIIKTNNFYLRMGLSIDALDELIKRRYKLLSVRVHPDKSSHEKAHEAFIALQEAYICLSNPDLRSWYDFRTKNSAEEIRAQNLNSTIEILKVLHGLGVKVPPEEKWPEFAEFIDALQENGTLIQIYTSQSKWASLGAIAGCFCAAPSPLLFCVLIALGPLPFTFAVFWEELMLQFDKTSLNEQILSRNLPSTLASMTKTTVAFTLLWCLFLGSSGYDFSKYMIQWGAQNIGLYSEKPIQLEEKEELVEWLMTEVNNEDIQFNKIFSVNSLATKEKLEDWLMVEVDSEEQSLERSWMQVNPSQETETN